jgi:hypothetical protein
MSGPLSAGALIGFFLVGPGLYILTHGAFSFDPATCECGAELGVWATTCGTIGGIVGAIYEQYIRKNR